ncbi:NUDIX hydrolase [Geopseudomonas aromaticivorans]
MTIQNFSPYLHTIDVVVLRYAAGTQPGRIEVLLHQRENEPYKDAWALPGLVVNGDIPDPSIEAAVKRLMASSKVGMEPVYIEQVGTEGNATRDPRCWSSTTYYFAIVAGDTPAGERQQFVALDDLVAQQRPAAPGRQANAYPLPFDHNRLCALVADRLVSKSLYSSLPLLFLGDTLTLTESADVTACVLGRPVQKSSMRTRLLAMVEAGYLQETDDKKQLGMGRPQSVIRSVKPGQVFFFDRSFEK